MVQQEQNNHSKQTIEKRISMLERRMVIIRKQIKALKNDLKTKGVQVNAKSN